MIEDYAFHYPIYFRITTDRNKELRAVGIYEDDAFSLLDFTVIVKNGVEVPNEGLYHRFWFDFPAKLMHTIIDYDVNCDAPDRSERVITYIGAG